MGEDASLDRFVSDSDGESEGAETTAAAADTETAASPESTTELADETEPTAGDEPTADDDVAPAQTTYAWDGAGAACDACGETVERRWQADGGLVCADCKDWDRP